MLKATLGSYLFLCSIKVTLELSEGVFLSLNVSLSMLKLHLKIANLATQLISCVFAHLRPVVSLRELLPERAYFGVHLLFFGLHRVELMA